MKASISTRSIWKKIFIKVINTLFDHKSNILKAKSQNYKLSISNFYFVNREGRF